MSASQAGASIPEPGQRRGRRRILAIVAVFLAACATLPWLVHPWYEASRETHDAALYILCAKSLLAGQGYSYLGEPFVVRPPGFSVLLLPILWMRGIDFAALNHFVSLFGAAAVALFFAFYRERLGGWVAAGLAACAWLNPGFRQLCNQAMSDVPGIALLFACLLLERRVSRRPSFRGDLLLGIAIGLSTYVRSGLGLLAPAVLAARVLEHLRASGERPSWPRFLRERVLVLAIVPALLLAPWSLRNAASHPPWPAEQTLLADYSTAMWHQDAGDPASPRVPLSAVLGRAPFRALELLHVLGGRMRIDVMGAFHWALGGITAAAIAFVLARRRAALELYALALAGVFLFYFASDDRLVLPIWMIGIGALAECAVLALSRFAGQGAARLATAGALVLVALLDFEPRRGWKSIETEFRARTELATEWKALVPPRARLAAPIGWHWSVLLDRPVWSLYFAARRAGMHGAEQLVQRRGIEFVVVSRDPPDDEVMTVWLLQHYPKLEQGGRGILFRVPH